MMRPPIAFLGLDFETPALDESVRFYTERFGLDAREGDGGEVALTAVGAAAPALMLRQGDAPRLAKLRYAYGDAGALDAARLAAQAAGLQPCHTQGGFALSAPGGTQVSFEVGVDASGAPGAAPTDRPLFMSHVVVNSREPATLVAFFRDVLGFIESDRYEKDLLTFLKCDQPQHHCLGVAPADSDGLNHFALDCGTIDALMRGLARMRALGHEPIWGPGRHGPGGNVFCYFEDPTGFVAEYTCEVLQIDDDASWQATEWKRTPENGNVWLSGGPSPRAIALMSGSGLTSATRAGTE